MYLKAITHIFERAWTLVNGFNIEDFLLIFHYMPVTTAVDSAQYAWLARLYKDASSYVNAIHFLCCSVTESLP